MLQAVCMVDQGIFINTFAEESNPDGILHDGRVVASGIIHKRKPPAAMHAYSEQEHGGIHQVTFHISLVR